jgi:hypothetical protein
VGDVACEILEKLRSDSMTNDSVEVNVAATGSSGKP